ncbi:HIG1 domain family member 2A-like protein [Leptotrombidium deliense]|uniref:HIG1 domain family member 2A-like protein n=1 Tax=Leptotrombidium deliense TaxID=299467 RepID=A0A443SDH0_9ACAR|nr:HIG1 domain family member 2A-like protein [Leptotrombidium deliense]
MTDEPKGKGVVDLSKESAQAKLEWIQVMDELNADIEKSESALDRTVRKFRENPLIPIGCLVTTYFLTRGLASMVQGDVKKQQLMMRGRVGAQAVTISIVAASMILYPWLTKKE